MLSRSDLLQHGFDFAVGADDEGAALGAHVFLAIHALLNPYAIGFDDLLVLIADERKWKFELGDEFLVLLDRVDADAKDVGLLFEFRPGITNGAGLRRASWSVVFRVEVEDSRLIGEFAEGHGRSFSVIAANDGCGEVGGFFTGLWFAHKKGVG